MTDDTTKPSTQLGIRLPTELVAQVDQYAAQLTQQTGTKVTRSAAVRILLTAALRGDQKNGR
jgi:hypothetical protein